MMETSMDDVVNSLVPQFSKFSLFYILMARFFQKKLVLQNSYKINSVLRDLARITLSGKIL